MLWGIGKVSEKALNGQVKAIEKGTKRDSVRTGFTHLNPKLIKTTTLRLTGFLLRWGVIFGFYERGILAGIYHSTQFLSIVFLQKIAKNLTGGFQTDSVSSASFISFRNWLYLG